MLIKTCSDFLGAVHKGRPQSEKRGVCPVWTFFGQEMRISEIFGSKKLRYFETYGLSAWTRRRGLSQ